jgi:hypothetical protein
MDTRFFQLPFIAVVKGGSLITGVSPWLASHYERVSETV